MSQQLPPYPKDAVRVLARKFKIKGCRELLQLWRFLRVARLIYQETKAEAVTGTSARPIRKLLRSVQDKTRALQDALTRLDAESTDPAVRLATEIFWSAASEVSQLALTHSELPPPYGHVFWKIDVPPDDSAIFWLDRAKLLAAVDILAAYSTRGLERTPSGKHGRPSDKALEVWVLNMESYVTGVLKRRFTLTTMRQQGFSRAFDFSFMALRPIDSSVREEALATAMRNLISRRRRQKTSKKPYASK